MAAGPAPKDPAQRRGRNVPQRGEWVDLPPVTHKVPVMPRHEWAAGSRLAWKAWWSDPASTQWTPADRDAVRQLLWITDVFERGKHSVAAECRLRMDLLGLTQKGKRDLRWRVTEGIVPATPVVKRNRRNLKVVV